MEGGLPGNVTDEAAIKLQSKQPCEPNETPQSSKYPVHSDAPEYRHTPTPNQEGLPYDVKISSQQAASFVRLMEKQDRHNQAPMQQSTAALALPQPSMQVFSGDPIDYCAFIHAFEHLVEQKITSSSSRLYYLVYFWPRPGANEELSSYARRRRRVRGGQKAAEGEIRLKPQDRCCPC